MQNHKKVYIKSYDAISVAGHGKDEIFENLLDKRCFLSEDSKLSCEDKRILTGHIAEKSIIPNNIQQDRTPLFVVGEADNIGVFAKTVKFKTSAEAVKAAFEAIRNGEEDDILLLAKYRLDNATVLELADNKTYSSSIARPFDIETDGLNAAEVSAYILFSPSVSAIELKGVATAAYLDQSMNDAIKQATLSATEIDYVEAAAAGIPAQDRDEAKAISDIFGQKPLVSSSKGMTGHSFEASAALSCIVAMCAAEEGFIAASAFLEHSFTNEVRFAYANKSLQIKNFIVNSNEQNGKFASFIFSVNKT